MKITIKNLFLMTFSATIIAKAMDGNELAIISGSAVLILFSFAWGLLALFQHARISAGSLATKVFLSLTAYFTIWALINIDNLDAYDSIWLLLRSLFMVLFMAVSCYWINRCDCLKEIIRCIYISFASIIVVLFFWYIRDIHLIRTLSTFWISEDQFRTRTKFGTSNNMAAEIAMTALLFSRANDFLYKEHTNLFKKILKVLVDFVMILVIIANNSRGTMVALFAMMAVAAIIKIFKKHNVQKAIRLFVTFFGGAVLGLIYYCTSHEISLIDLMENTNRTHWQDNLAILERSGRWMFGIGRVSGGYFAGENILYGLKTNYMEIFYIYVFITSGIIGSACMIGILGLILKRIYQVSQDDFGEMSKWGLLVFSYALFISLFEDYIFSYGYVTSMCIMICVISFLDISKNVKQTYK